MDLYIFACILPAFARWLRSERFWSVICIPLLIPPVSVSLHSGELGWKLGHWLKGKGITGKWKFMNPNTQRITVVVTSLFCKLLLCSLIIICYTLIFLLPNAPTMHCTISPHSLPRHPSTIILLKFKPIWGIIFSKCPLQYFKTKFQHFDDIYGTGSWGRNVP